MKPILNISGFFFFKKFPTMLVNVTAIRRKTKGTMDCDLIIFLNRIYTSIIITTAKVMFIIKSLQ